jgi:predicted lipoprotein
MTRKSINYILAIAIAGFLLYNSIYIKKLSDSKTSETKPFDAVAYAREYVFVKIPGASKNAIDIVTLLEDLTSNPDHAFAAYSHAQNPGDTRYFLVKGHGEVVAIDGSYVHIKIAGESEEIKLATEYILGNAARDGSGLISVDEFVNTMELNNVSEEINKLIRKEILPPFEANVRKGSTVTFMGGVEQRQSHPTPKDLEVIPLSVEILK